MSKAQAPLSVEQRRTRAAELLTLVLEEAITPDYALHQWPAETRAGLAEDPSMQAAYQALWHFASDGGLREEEPYYLDVQLDVLRTVAWFLGQGQSLPADMLAAYRLHATQTAPPRYHQHHKAPSDWLGVLHGMVQNSLNAAVQALTPLMEQLDIWEDEEETAAHPPAAGFPSVVAGSAQVLPPPLVAVLRRQGVKPDDATEQPQKMPASDRLSPPVQRRPAVTEPPPAQPVMASTSAPTVVQTVAPSPPQRSSELPHASRSSSATAGVAALYQSASSPQAVAPRPQPVIAQQYEHYMAARFPEEAAEGPYYYNPQTESLHQGATSSLVSGGSRRRRFPSSAPTLPDEDRPVGSVGAADRSPSAYRPSIAVASSYAGEAGYQPVTSPHASAAVLPDWWEAFLNHSDELDSRRPQQSGVLRQGQTSSVASRSRYSYRDEIWEPEPFLAHSPSNAFRLSP